VAVLTYSIRILVKQYGLNSEKGGGGGGGGGGGTGEGGGGGERGERKRVISMG